MRTILSLGAGIQSSALVHLILDRQLPDIDAVVYLNSGLDPNYTYAHAAWLATQCKRQSLPFLVVQGPSLREAMDHITATRATAASYIQIPLPMYTLDTSGSRGQLPRRCTRQFRLRPLFNFFRRNVIPPNEQNGHPKPWLRVLLGITADETRRAKPSRELWKINTYPLVTLDWTREDCQKYMADHNHRLPLRSSCAICPYRSNQEWANLRHNDPENWNYACDLDRRLRTLGRPGTHLYLHQSRRPLEVVTLPGGQLY